MRDYLLGVLWALVLGGSIMAWPVSREHRGILLRLWAIRCLVTLGVMLIYENLYRLDAHGYYYVAQVLQFEGLEFGAGTRNIYQLAALHYGYVAESYHAMKVTWSMVGLLGCYLFYRAAATFLERDSPRVLYLLGLFPSVLFWSSILGKDPINFLGVSLYAYGVVRVAHQGRLGGIPIAASGVLIAMMIRVWTGVIMVAPLAVFAVARLRGRAVKIVFLAVVALAFDQTLGRMAQQFSIETQDDVIERTSAISRGWATGGSAQELGTEFGNLGTMVAFLPVGIFTALFRPLPGEVLNVFGVLAGLENAVLLVWFLQMLRRARLRDLNPVLLWGALYVLLWASAYGFVSYQNLGTAVRFRLQVLPLMLLIILYLRLTPERRAALHGNTSVLPFPARPSAQVRAA